MYKFNTYVRCPWLIGIDWMDIHTYTKNYTEYKELEHTVDLD